MDVALNGVLVGLGLSVLIGPVFFLYLELGISRGFRAGLSLAGGVWLSDTLIIILMYNFLTAISHLLQNSAVSYVLGGVGGTLLIAFGIVGLYQQYKEEKKLTISEKIKNNYQALFAKGFILNTFNPFAFIFWMGVMGSMVMKSDFNSQTALWFFGFLIFTVIGLDMLKIYLAKCIRLILTQKHIQVAKRAISFSLVIFGIVLFARILF